MFFGKFIISIMILSLPSLSQACQWLKDNPINYAEPYLYFEKNRFNINNNGFVTINSVTEFLKNYIIHCGPIIKIKFTGHSNVDEEDKINLSYKRANISRDQFIEEARKKNIDLPVIHTVGASDSFPIAEPMTELGSASNRRVVISICFSLPCY